MARRETLLSTRKGEGEAARSKPRILVRNNSSEGASEEGKNATGWKGKTKQGSRRQNSIRACFEVLPPPSARCFTFHLGLFFFFLMSVF